MAEINILSIRPLDYREGFDVTVEMVADDGRVGNKTFFCS